MRATHRGPAFKILVGLCSIVLVLSCRDDMGPQPPAEASVSLFSLLQATAGAQLDVAQVQVVLRREDGRVAAADTVQLTPGQQEVDITLTFDPEVSPETFTLELFLLDETGEVVFAGEAPVTVDSNAGTAEVAAPTLSIVGPGAAAESIEITDPEQAVLFDSTVALTATVRDGNGDAVDETVVRWRSLDATRAFFPDAAEPIVQGGSQRGIARLVATAIKTIDAEGSSGPEDTIEVDVLPIPGSIAVVSGNDQGAPVTTLLADPLVLEVLGTDDLPLEGIEIELVENTGGSFSNAMLVTDAVGRASVFWTMGDVAGPHSGTATVAGLPTVTTDLLATAEPGAVATLEILGGDGQTGVVGQELGTPLSVRALDGLGNVVPDEPVTFTVNSGGGSVAGTGVTDAGGVAEGVWTLGTTAGEPQEVEAMAGENGPAPAPGTGLAARATAVFTAAAIPDVAAVVAFAVDPASTTSQTNFATDVELLDQFGNRATGDSNTDVTVAIAQGTGAAGAVLSGSTTLTAASGLVSFVDLQIDLASVGYQLEATATGLTDATSASFDITAGAIAIVEVTPGDVTLDAIGDMVAYTATARDGAGNVVATGFAWSTDDPAVATVSPDGEATAIDNGTVTITATAAGIDGTTTLTVLQEAASVTVAPPNVALSVFGQTAQFTATVEDANGNDITGAQITWEVSDSAVVSIDATGQVTAIADGSATVFATSGAAVGNATATVALSPQNRWINPAGGNWSDRANWSNGAPPAAADTAVFDLAATYTVTLDVDPTIDAVAFAAPSGIVTLTGGTLTVTQDLTSQSNAGVHLSDLTLDGSGSLIVLPGPADVQASDNTTINVTVDIQGRFGAFGIVNLNGAVALPAGGTLQTGNFNAIPGNLTLANLLFVAGSLEMIGDLDATVTTAQGVVITATGTLLAGGNGGTRRLDAAVDNQGGIVVNRPLEFVAASVPHDNSGTITLDGGDLTVTQSGAAPNFTQRGTIVVTAGETFQVSGGVVDWQTGAVVSGQGVVSFTGGVTVNVTPDIAHDANVQFDLGDATINGPGTLTVAAGASELALDHQVTLNLDVNVDGSLGAYGVNTINGGLTIPAGGTLRTGNFNATPGNLTIANGPSVDGTLEMTGDLAATVNVMAGALTIGQTGTFLSAGTGGARTAGGAIINNGVLTVDRSLALTGDFTHQAGAMLNGTAALDLTAANVIAFAGDVNPGTSPGILGLVGTYAPTSSSNLNVELEGLLSTEHDRLDVTGATNLGGSLNVTLGGGFGPVAGNEFPILTFTSTSGAFTTLNFPALGVLTMDTASTTGQSPDTLYLVVSAGAPMGTEAVWTGTTSSDWFDGSNWSTGVVPDDTTTVFVPAGTTNDPAIATATGTVDDLVVAAGATLTVTGATLVASGNVDAGSTIVGGTLEMAGPSATLRGVVPLLHVTGDLTLDGPVTADEVDVEGNLTLGGNQLDVNGLFATTNGTGILSMFDPADVLDVIDATFAGGSMEDIVTDGVIRISGDFVQNGTIGDQESFQADNVVEFDGTGPQTITFDTPGRFQSHFESVEVTGTGPITNGGANNVVVTERLTNTTTAWQVNQTEFDGVGAITISGETGGGSYLFTGPVAPTGGFTLNGDVTITSSLSIGSFTVTVNGDVFLSGSGTLGMTDSDGQLNVENIIFGGGSTSGLLTDGSLGVTGDLTQLGPTTTSLDASGNFAIRLNGAAPQVVAFANPGPSSFHHIEFSNTAGGITLATDVVATGQLRSFGATTPVVDGGGNTLQVAGFNVSGLELDNLPLTSIDGTLVQFVNVTFDVFDPTVTQFTVEHPGFATGFPFSGLVFNTVPTTGFYLSANDNLDDANTLQIDMLTPTPATGPPFVETAGGAIVNWPGSLVNNSWDAAVSGNWSDGDKWSKGVPPVPTDNVFITVDGDYAVTVNVDAEVATLNLGGTSGTQTLDLGPQTLTLNGDMNISASGEFLLNVGTTNGTGQIFNDGTIDLAGSTIEIPVENRNRLQSRATSALNGPLTTTGTSIIDVTQIFAAPSTLTVASGFTNNGVIELSNPNGNLTAQTLVVAGTLVNAGGAEIRALAGLGTRVLSAELNNSGFLRVQGDLVMNAASADHTNAGGVILVTGGDLTVTQSGVTPSFVSTGLLEVDAGFTATVTAGTFANDVGGTLSGNGTIELSAVTFTNDGLVSPGATVAPPTIGTLTIDGSPVFGATSELDLELGGVTAGSLHDQLIVTGDVTLAGELIGTLVNAYVPSVGDALTVLTYGSQSADFDTYTLAGLPADREWSPTLTPGALVLNVVATFPGAVWESDDLGDPTNWEVGENWSTGAVPDAATDVLIPAAATPFPLLTADAFAADVIVEPGASIETAGFNLTAAGDVDAGTTITGTGTVIMTGAATTVQGVVPNLTIQENVQAAAGVTVNGDLVVSGVGANFSLGAQTVTVTGSAQVTTFATLTMDDPSNDDLLDVAVDLEMFGSSTDGLLTNGTIEVGGNFVQNFGTTAFRATGSHIVVFDGSGAQTVEFLAGTTNQFANFVMAGSGSVEFLTDVQIGGSASVSGPVLGTGVTAAIGGDFTDAGANWSVENTVVTGVDPALPPVVNSNLTVSSAPATLSAPLTVNGVLAVSGTGADLILNGQTVTVNGDFFTTSAGRVTVNESTDFLDVNANAGLSLNGDVGFFGAVTAGRLLDGRIEVEGNFTQNFGAQSFRATANNVFVFDGTAPQTAEFLFGTGSQFATVEFNGVSVDFLTDAVLAGDVTVNSGVVTATDLPLHVGGHLVDNVGLGWQPDSTTMSRPAGEPTLPDVMQTVLTLFTTKTLSAPFSVTGGLILDVGGTLDLGGNTATVTGDFFTTNTGELVMATGAGDALAVTGDVGFFGTANDQLSTGTITVGGNFTQDFVGTAFQPSGSHRVIFDGGGVQDVAFNFGTGSAFQNVTVASGATLSATTDVLVNDDVTVAAGGALRLGTGTNFTPVLNFSLAATAILEGTGALDLSNAPTTLFGGTVAPGDGDAGQLQFNGSFDFEPGSDYDVEIGGLTPGSGHDQIDLSGALTLDGTLNVSILEPFVPANGNVFVIATFGSGGGAFTTLNLPTLSPGLSWTPTLTATTFELAVTGPSLEFLTEPTDVEELLPIAPAVEVRALDGTGAFDPSFTGAVTIAIDTDPSGGTATLGGVLTRAAVAGVATFPDLSLDVVATGYTLVATSTGLSDATSAAFDVTASGFGGSQWTGVASGDETNWNNPANWNTGVVPTATDDVLIRAAAPNEPTLTADGFTNALTVEPGVTVTIPSTLTLDVSGDLDAGATIVGAGTVFKRGAGTSIVGTVSNLTVTDSIVMAGDVTVTGDLFVFNESGALSSNVLDIEGFTLTVGGTLTSGAAGNANLRMDGAGDVVNVTGDAVFNGYQGDNVDRFSAGVLTIGGNVTQGVSASAFVSNGSHQVVLNGSVLQTITLANPSTARFNQMDFVNTGAGVTLGSDVNVDGDFNATGTVTIPGGFALEVHGAIDVIGATLAGAGQVEKVGAATAVSGTFVNLTVGDSIVMDDDLNVTGDLTIGDGPGAGTNVLHVSGFTLTVGGDLFAGVGGFANLRLDQPTDLVIVTGDIAFAGGGTADRLSDGVLQVAGDFSQSNGNTYSPTGPHRLVLNGGGAQTVTMADVGTSWFNDVDIANTGTGVTLATDIRVVGRLQMLAGDLIQTAPQELQFQNLMPITSPGYQVATTQARDSLVLDQNITIPNGGDLVAANGAAGGSNVLDIQEFTLNVTGDLIAGSGGFSNIRMDDPAAIVIVEGDLSFQGGGSGDRHSDGTLFVRGNITSTPTLFNPTGSHTIVLDGSGAQSVSIADPVASTWQNVTFANTGPGVTLTTDLVIDGNTAWTTGAIDVTDGFQLVNDATGVFDIQGDVSTTVTTGLFVNTGVMTKSAGAGATTFGLAVFNSGTIDASSGMLVFAADLTHSDGAVIQGDGGIVDISGPATTFTLDGDFNPGTSPGVLTMTDEYTPTTASTLNIEIEGLLPGEHDQFDILGVATLGGAALNVTIGGAYVPAHGDQIPVLTFASATGAFDLTVPPLAGNLVMDTMTVIAGGAPDTLYMVVREPALEFTIQPVDVAVNAAMADVEVTAFNEFGLVDNDFSGTVTLTIGTNPGGGLLNGGAPVNAVAVSGVATFSSLTIDQGGVGYTLVATATGVLDATSDPFDVTVPLNLNEWTGDGNGTSWDDPDNWSIGVPIVTDSVVIRLGSPSVVIGTSPVTIEHLDMGDGATSNPTLNFTQALSITGTIAVADGSTFLMQSPLTGGATGTIDGTWTWNSGDFTGGGTVTVSGTGTLEIGGSTRNMGGSSQILNDGTITWNSSSLTLFDGGTITNRTGGVFNSPGPMQFFSGSAPGPLVNEGLLSISGGVTNVINVPFDNTDSVEVLVNTLAIGGAGTHAGNFGVAAGAVLDLLSATHDVQGNVTGAGMVDLGGTVTFQPTSVLDAAFVTVTSGASTFDGAYGAAIDSIDVAAGTATFLTPLTVPFLEQAGTIDGSADITVTDSLAWENGTHGGSGTTTIGAGAVLLIRDPVTHSIADTRSFLNQGTADMTGATLSFPGGGAKTFTNDGSFTLNTDFGFSGAAPSAFVNNGTFEKASGALQSDIGVPFVNNATIAANSGSLRFSDDFTHADDAVIQGTAEIQLAAANILTFEGDVVPGTSPGELTWSGDFDPTALTNLEIELEGTTPAEHDILTVEGFQGNVTLDGVLNVTVSGFTPADNDQFPIVTGTSIAGDFATLNFPNISPLTFDTMTVAGGANPDTLYLVVEGTPLTAIVWTGGSGIWSDIDNWDLGRLPGLGDSAIIDVDGITVDVNVSPNIGFLAVGESGNTVTIDHANGLTLALQDGGFFSSTATINVGGGSSFEGPADVEIAGTFNVDDGTLQGIGVTRITAGTSTFASAGFVNLDGRAVEITGGTLIIENGGSFNESNGGSLTVLPSGTLDLRADNMFVGTPAPTITNNGGTINKIAGPLVTRVDWDIVNTGTGTFNVNSGTLDLRGALDHQSGTIAIGSGALFLSGGHSDIAGDVDIALGGVLQLNATGRAELDKEHLFTVGSSVTGAGTFDANGAALVDIRGDYDVGHTLLSSSQLEFNSATTSFTDTGSYSGGGFLAGSGTFAIRTAFSSVGGNIEGTGTILVLSGAVFTPNSPIRTWTVDVAGSLIYPDGVDMDLETGGTINVLPGGEFDLQGNGQVFASAAETIDNAGSFIKSGTGVRIVRGSIINNGTIDVQDQLGTLDLRSLTHQPGALIQGDGTLVIGSATPLVLDGDFGPGASPGDLDISGNYAPTGSSTYFAEIGGTTQGTDHDALIVSGSATLNGTLDVTVINDFTPLLGQVFPIVTYGSRPPSGFTLNSPALTGGVEFDTATVGSTYQLEVVETVPGGFDFAWNGSVSGAWTTAGNWTPGGVPGSSDNVFISGVPANQPSISSVENVLDLTLGAGATVNVSETQTLTVSGDLDATNGSFLGEGIVVMDGSGTTLAGTVRHISIESTVDAIGPVTATGDLEVVGSGSTLSIDGTTVTANTATAFTAATITGSGTLNVSGAVGGLGTMSVGTLIVGGTLADLFAAFTVTTVEFDGAFQTVPVLPYQNIIASGNDVTFGDATLTGDLTVPGTFFFSSNDGNFLDVGGDVIVSGTGFLEVADNDLTTGGNLETQDTGVFQMGNDAGGFPTVIVGGDAIFGGGSTDGQMTFGTLQVAGDLIQTSANSTTSFAASGTHLTILDGVATQLVQFDDPGTAASRFNDLQITNASVAGVTLASDVWALHQFVTPADATPRNVFGQGNVVHAFGVSLHNLTLDDLPLDVLYNGGAQSFTSLMNTVTFQNMDPTVTQLNMVRDFETSTLIDLVFSTVPSSGLYVFLDDDDDAPTNPTFNFTNPTPAVHGGFLQDDGNVIVTGWPES